MTASSLVKISDGYVILGNTIVDDKANDTTYVQSVIIKTDEKGNRIGDFSRANGGTGKVIQPIISNGSITGYVVIGDSTYLNPLAEQASNVIVTSLRALFLDANFNILRKFYISGDTSRTYIEDFTGESVEISSDGKIYILGTLKDGVINQQTAPAKPFIIALNSNFSLDWYKQYDVNGRTTQNSKSIHYSDGKIIWASSLSIIQGDFNKSWVTIPIVEENSVFPNFSFLGQNSDQMFLVKDIQPSSIPGFGYGVVGTYSKATDGSNGNIFFIQVDAQGNIVKDSDRYFDAVSSETEGAVSNRDISSIVDDGGAITSTRDGGFILAGTMETNSDKGKGGKDLVLIKLDAFGNLIWMKTMGGSGDEEPSNIMETEDGDLVILGTNTLGTYSSIFLMKTDKNGELKN
jgi:hypothetical protein